MKRTLIVTAVLVWVLAGDARADQMDGIVAKLRSADENQQAMGLADLMRNRNLVQDPVAAKKAADAAGECLLAKQAIIRGTAVDAFALLDLPGGRKLVPTMWTDPSWMVRHAVVGAMVAYAKRDGKVRDATPWIVKGLEDPHWSVRWAAAFEINRRLETVPKESVKPLAKALAAKDSKLEKKDAELVRKTREEMAKALAKAGEKAAPAVTELIGALEDDGPLVRAHAATALGNIGEKAAKAEPALAELLKDKQAEVRRAAAFALSSFTPTEASSARSLAKLLKDKDAKTCVHAATALGRMGETASTAMGALVRALGSKDVELRAAAATACGRIGPKAKSALSKLTKLAEKDANEKVRAAATEAAEAIRGE